MPKPPLKLWKESILKWKAIVAGLKSGDFAGPGGLCGFCAAWLKPVGDCTRCPLFPRHCAYDYDYDATFWRASDAMDLCDKSRALTEAQKMLRAIRRCRHYFAEEGE